MRRIGRIRRSFLLVLWHIAKIIKPLLFIFLGMFLCFLFNITALTESAMNVEHVNWVVQAQIYAGSFFGGLKGLIFGTGVVVGTGSFINFNYIISNGANILGLWDLPDRWITRAKQKKDEFWKIVLPKEKSRASKTLKEINWLHVQQVPISPIFSNNVEILADLKTIIGMQQKVIELRVYEHLKSGHALFQDLKQCSLILGSSGSGKTTLLHYIESVILEKDPAIFPNAFSEAFAGVCLPIYIDLTQYALTLLDLKGPEMSLLEFASLELYTRYNEYFREFRISKIKVNEYLEEAARRGNIVFLLDHLDNIWRLPANPASKIIDTYDKAGQCYELVIKEITNLKNYKGESEATSKTLIILTKCASDILFDKDHFEYFVTIGAIGDFRLEDITNYIKQNEEQRSRKSGAVTLTEGMNSLQSAMRFNMYLQGLAANHKALDMLLNDDILSLSLSTDYVNQCTKVINQLLQEAVIVKSRALNGWMDKERLGTLLEQFAWELHRKQGIIINRSALKDKIKSFLTSQGFNAGAHQPVDFIEECADLLIYQMKADGLLREDARDKFLFSCFTYQIYFTARYMQNNSNVLNDVKRSFPGPWWNSVVWLYEHFVSSSNPGNNTIDTFLRGWLDVGGIENDPLDHAEMHKVMLAGQALAISRSSVSADLKAAIRFNLYKTIIDENCLFIREQICRVVSTVESCSAISRNELAMLVNELDGKPGYLSEVQRMKRLIDKLPDNISFSPLFLPFFDQSNGPTEEQQAALRELNTLKRTNGMFENTKVPIELRLAMLHAISIFDNPNLANHLSDLLSKRDLPYLIKGSVVYCIGLLGNGSHVECLFKLLSDHKSIPLICKWYAVNALIMLGNRIGYWGSSQIASGLQKLLDDSEQDPFLRWKIALTLVTQLNFDLKEADLFSFIEERVAYEGMRVLTSYKAEPRSAMRESMIQTFIDKVGHHPPQNGVHWLFAYDFVAQLTRNSTTINILQHRFAANGKIPGYPKHMLEHIMQFMQWEFEQRARTLVKLDAI